MPDKLFSHLESVVAGVARDAEEAMKASLQKAVNALLVMMMTEDSNSEAQIGDAQLFAGRLTASMNATDSDSSARSKLVHDDLNALISEAERYSTTSNITTGHEGILHRASASTPGGVHDMNAQILDQQLVLQQQLHQMQRQIQDLSIQQPMMQQQLPMHQQCFILEGSLSADSRLPMLNQKRPQYPAPRNQMLDSYDHLGNMQQKVLDTVDSGRMFAILTDPTLSSAFPSESVINSGSNSGYHDTQETLAMGRGPIMQDSDGWMTGPKGQIDTANFHSTDSGSHILQDPWTGELQLNMGGAYAGHDNRGQVTRIQLSGNSTSRLFMRNPAHAAPSFGRAVSLPTMLPQNFPKATLSDLPPVVLAKLRQVLVNTEVLKEADFDDKVVGKMVSLIDMYNNDECLRMLDHLESRIRSKQRPMKNGAGYIDVAVSSYIDKLSSRGKYPASMGMAEYAKQELEPPVFKQMKTTLESNRCLEWEHMDESLIQLLKKLPVDSAVDKLREISRHSFKHVINVKGCLVSILNSRIREDRRMTMPSRGPNPESAATYRNL